MTKERRDWLIAGALLALGTFCYAFFVVQDYSGPLIGPEDYDNQFRGDANYYEFLGYYVHDHWHFGLDPISFFTKDVGYPYGTHIGMLSWCPERDLFSAALLGLFGVGPWVQLHCTLGAAVGAVGVALVLRPQLGILRASLVGYAGSFMAFYAWYKYPYHVNMVPIHWVIISIAADAVTIRLIAEGKRMSAPFVIFRAAFIALSMGLDLGYIAGFSLMSLTVTVLCAWGELGKRDRRILGRFRLAFPEDFFGELRARENRLATLGATALLLYGVLFILPLAAAVFRDTRTYPMTDTGGNFWASWFHALFPYFPGTHPNSALVHKLFGKDEGTGEYTPGYTLLLACIVGVVLAHRRNLSPRIKPLLITALLVFAYHPRWCKTLGVFPWFAYFRVAGRGTVVLPILLALIGGAMEDWPKLAKRALVVLGAIEVVVATAMVSDYRPYVLSAQQKEYFSTVKAAKGEALLEWPFCIASANVIITHELCPYYHISATAYAYRRFDQKARVSIYLSRVGKHQFENWLEDGWEGMFMPDDPARDNPTKELRCFDDEQWARFDRLYQGHDFAGLQIYPDRLPAECVEQFHARYGLPKITSKLPRVGPVEFIPRRP